MTETKEVTKEQLKEEIKNLKEGQSIVIEFADNDDESDDN